MKLEILFNPKLLILFNELLKLKLLTVKNNIRFIITLWITSSLTLFCYRFIFIGKCLQIPKYPAPNSHIQQLYLLLVGCLETCLSSFTVGILIPSATYVTVDNFLKTLVLPTS